MKRIISILLTVVLAISFFGCGKKEASKGSTSEKIDVSSGTSSDTLNVVIDANEYTLYQNIFMNDQAKQFADKTVTKKGVFTTIYDAFSKMTRYYVWGYYDNTKCCDWQWELKLNDTSSLPEDGSIVTVTGLFVNDENALDQYWIKDVEMSVDQHYTGKSFDYNMATMSATLERVEIQNIIANPDDFEGKTCSAYGRVLSLDSVQHPYYDNQWEMKITSGDKLPAIGKMVLVEGTIKQGNLSDAKVSETKQYT